MTDILNLDALKTDKQFTLGGTTRSIRSMTVQEFIDAGDFDKKYVEANPSEQIGMLVDLVAKFVEPETKKSELKKLTLQQLTALLNYARSADESNAEGNAESAA